MINNLKTLILKLFNINFCKVCSRLAKVVICGNYYCNARCREIETHGKAAVLAKHRAVCKKSYYKTKNK